MLIGLGKMIKRVTSSFNLLVTKVLGFTYGPGGGSSYYTTMQGSKEKGYVSVGPNGFNEIQHSTDGINWTRKNLPGFSIFSDSIAYGAEINNGEGIWVAISSGYSNYSIDGINWTSTVFPFSVYQVKYVNNNFIGITQEGHVYQSSDGKQWSITADFSSNFQNLGANLHSFENQIYADGKSSNGLLAIYTTSTIKKAVFLKVIENDVLLQSNVVTDIPISGSINGVAWNGTNMVLYGEGDEDQNQAIAYATYSGSVLDFNNGNWNSVDTTGLGIDNAYQSVTYIDFFLIEGFPSETLYMSQDGITWSTYNKPSGNFSQMHYSGNDLTFAVDSTLGLQRTFAGNVWRDCTISEGSLKRIDSVLYVGGTPSSSDPNVLSGGKYVIYGFDLGDNRITIESSTGVNFTVASRDFYGRAGSEAVTGKVSTLVEVQVAIGNQGEEGAEILAPVDVYTVPSTKTADIDQVTVKNNSANTITYDLAVLDPGVELTDQNALISDQAISAGATATISNIASPMTAGQRIVVFPSAVDVVEVKVFGTETSIPLNYFMGLEYAMDKGNAVGMFLDATQTAPAIGSTITISGNNDAEFNQSYTVDSYNLNTNFYVPSGAVERVILIPSTFTSNMASYYYTMSVGGNWVIAATPPPDEEVTLDFSNSMNGWAQVYNDDMNPNHPNAVTIRLMGSAVNTALATTPDPESDGWVGATFTINNPTPYMGGQVPSVLNETFTVVGSIIVDLGMMGKHLYLITSSTTSVGSQFDFNATASVYLP